MLYESVPCQGRKELGVNTRQISLNHSGSVYRVVECSVSLNERPLLKVCSTQQAYNENVTSNTITLSVMSRKPLPIEISDFKPIVEGGYAYADKTLLCRNIFDLSGSEPEKIYRAFVLGMLIGLKC